jgi:hypothetical protein
LIGSPRTERRFSSLDLTPVGQKDKWLWVAVYEWHATGTGPVPWAYAIVLMDGTVVKPEIIDDPKGRLFLTLGADE